MKKIFNRCNQVIKQNFHSTKTLMSYNYNSLLSISIFHFSKQDAKSALEQKWRNKLNQVRDDWKIVADDNSQK